MHNYFQFTDTGHLDEKIILQRFPFNEKLFWDCAIDTIDLKKTCAM